MNSAQEVTNLWPFVVYSISVVALLVVTLLASWLLGTRTRARSATNIPFESGIVPVGSPEKLRLSVEFYLIAMFFVIFDLETIFIFAWAIAFDELGWRGYLGASVFILILLVALVYELSTGELDWGIKQRARRERYAQLEESSG